MKIEHPSQQAVDSELKGLMSKSGNRFDSTIPAADFLNALPHGRLDINRELHRLMSESDSRFETATLAADFLRSLPPPLFGDVISALRTPGNWNGQQGYLAPWLLTRLPGWPENRILTIHAHGSNPQRYAASGREHIGGIPLNLLLHHQYYDLLNTERSGDMTRIIPIPADGDCFYHAVLNGLSIAERQSILGYRSSENITTGDIIQLRQLHAEYLLNHPNEPLSFINPH
jgi:hypothetical protein